jgi:hypothetical protein
MFNQSAIARNLSAVPGYITSNQTHLPAWAVPYQSDATKKDDTNIVKATLLP